MKNSNLLKAFTLMAICLGFTAALRAQTSSIDKPIKIEQNVIEAEGDGKAETLYYYIDVNKGTLKVVVDAKTDDRSTPLRVTLMDEDGKELLPIYVVATGSGKRETASRKLVKGMRVVIKIATQDDPQVNHLTYKIRLQVPEDVPQPTASITENGTSSAPTQEGDSNSAPTQPASTPESQETALGTKAKIRAKVKAAAKVEAKKVLSSILPY
jgi:hypothetical protein